MGQALYRKHRPKSLKEVVGQEHITRTLATALKDSKISHAYLFTGPRGTGKTSVARILAHEINGLPYDDDAAHLDIIEIDAASNRRIDEIRELRDKVYVAPTSAKYKVYIIDEVHMLTKEAFNALLKTLEEPPEHAVFILATTDAHKLPATIISRTQRYSFKPVALPEVVDHLKYLAKAEKITINDDALQLLAEHGEGSFRDSISLLDQASSHGDKIDVAMVQNLLGLPPKSAIITLVNSLHGRPVSEIIQQLSALYDQGYQATAIAKELHHLIWEQVLAGEGSAEQAALLHRLLEVPTAHDPERFLEIILIEGSLSAETSVRTMSGHTSSEAPTPEPKAKPEVKAEAVVEALIVEEPVLKTEEPEPQSIKQKPIQKGSTELNEETWPEVLSALKGNHNTLYGTVRMAQPRFSGGNLTLAFAFPFHQKRLNEARNRQLLSQVIEAVTGKVVEIDCIVDAAAKPTEVVIASTQAESAPDPALSTISNIFGGAELLE